MFSWNHSTLILKQAFVFWGLNAAVLLMAVSMFALNHYCFCYPGLFYFEPTFLGLAIFLFAVRYGLYLQFNFRFDTYLLKLMKAFGLYSLIIVVILFSTSAIQYTPFPPIDKKIIWAEHALHLDLQASINWFGSLKGGYHTLAHFVYDSVAYQVLFLPLIVMLLQDYERIDAFFFLVLVSWMLGSLVYYFFPTTAPASVLNSPYFVSAQHSTGLKFWQLHHYIQPKTAEGGLIAMPSFHVIWAWLSVYLLRPWRVVFYFMLGFNLLMVASCVLLGWHYFLDIVGSIMVLLLSHGIYEWCITPGSKDSALEPGEGVTNSHPL